MAAKKQPPKRPLRLPVEPVGPWEPNPTQLEWYRLWTQEMWGPSKIAAEAKPKVTRQTVHEAVNKVGEWYRHLCHHEIMSFKDRQTHIFEQIIQEAWEGWRKSIGNVVVVTDTKGEHASTQKKTHVSHGDVAYLDRVMAACESIQKLWGFNAPSKQQIDVRHGEDIPGIPSAGGFGSRAAVFEHAMKVLEEGHARARQMEAKASSN